MMNERMEEGGRIGSSSWAAPRRGALLLGGKKRRERVMKNQSTMNERMEEGGRTWSSS